MEEQLYLLIKKLSIFSNPFANLSAIDLIAVLWGKFTIPNHQKDFIK